MLSILGSPGYRIAFFNIRSRGISNDVGTRPHIAVCVIVKKREKNNPEKFFFALCAPVVYGAFLANNTHGACAGGAYIHAEE